MKTIIMFHGADLDGLASGAILYQWATETKGWNRQSISLIPASYHMSVPWNDIKDNRVLMADFSLQPWNEMEALYKLAKEMVWIDHHVSAIAAYRESRLLIPGIQDLKAAACELCWEYCFPRKEIPESVHLLSRYDTWDLDTEVLDFQYGMQALWPEPDDRRWWSIFNKNYDSLEIRNNGASIRQFLSREWSRSMRDQAFETTLFEYKVLACNKWAGGSLLFQSRWDPRKHDIMLSFYLRKDLNWTVSIYTDKPEIDCSAIAKQFDGGGHRSAAGFQCKELPFQV